MIAFSAHPGLRVPHTTKEKTQTMALLRNDEMSSLFMAVIEAIINALTKAGTLEGWEGHTGEALPLDRVIKILKRYNAVR